MTSETTSLFPAAVLLPGPYDPARAERTLEGLGESAESALGAVLRDGACRHLVMHVSGASPYLARLMLREQEALHAILTRGAQVVTQDALEEMAAADREKSVDALHAAMRRAKRKAALAIALGDVGGALDLFEVTGHLSDLAEAAIGAATRFHLRAAHDAGKIVLKNREAPEEGSGLIILAMGKFGARELNYSSDIDIVVFFEPDHLKLAGNQEEAPFFVRLTQDIVRAIQTVTADGYVFRCDLRLRPDPSATQVAISAPAAEIYYESMGQNWERAAFIKARAVGGDRKAGEAFLHMLTPFVFRRHLDYAAIDDMRAMKRQIHAARGHKTIAVEGHDIKLGRGGIREVEFYVQTRQLVLGGREMRLRGRETRAMLDALVALNHVPDVTRDELMRAYRFFRTVEHRVQMTDDEQTHKLPADAAGVARIANFAGYDDADAFRAELLAHLANVERHFDSLFDNAPAGEGRAQAISLVTEDDVARLGAALEAQGFKRGTELAPLIQNWTAGRIRATRSPRAREKLAALLPALIADFARAPDPDQTLLGFDRFVSGLPAGVQLFALFQANPALMALVVEVLGQAPRIARHLAQRPGVIDAMLDPAFLLRLPDEAEVENLFRQQTENAESLEGVLDAARRIANEQRFRIGLSLLRGHAGAIEAGRAYADVASVLVSGLLAHVRADIVRQHGAVPDSHCAIVAMGKCGARQMTAASDLDLMFIYEFDDEVVQSDGARPLAPSQYFAKVSQRMIAALTSLTAEGRLYDVDMRLRPSGNKGPVATRLASFIAYQRDEAWTWERMALTKARVIAGDDGFIARVQAAIDGALMRPAIAFDIFRDARAMRRRMKAERSAADCFDVKIADGGQIDAEFIAQALLLAHQRPMPHDLPRHAVSVIDWLEQEGVVPAEDARALVSALTLYEAVTQIARVALEGKSDSAEAFAQIAPLLLRGVEMTSFAALEEAIRAAEADVTRLFDKLLPAEAAGES